MEQRASWRRVRIETEREERGGVEETRAGTTSAREETPSARSPLAPSTYSVALFAMRRPKATAGAAMHRYMMFFANAGFTCAFRMFILRLNERCLRWVGGARARASTTP